ncbi:class I SAM-dependent methyltransferase [Pigmentiphaga sp. H8]|uniref:class I SAM-dependent methyltransferase n=1 Tax=Pigmentiphaga sp. H8 TaxID=2488560 RepID=UPI000F59C4B6|nr:class I SAM-dependent methyltransferase [Pigmentiphaga sp. H8]AZG07736.1 class I SAM-dependent methyltransferase [Pigmentiphaga sp. H8]
MHEQDTVPPARLFVTPDALADTIVDHAYIRAGHRLCEPSAGTGALLRAVRRRFGQTIDCVAVEINGSMARGLVDQGLNASIIHGDFLSLTRGEIGEFDRIVMSPPFENGRDVDHIRKALTLLRPGGRLVALCIDGPRQNRYLRPIVEERRGIWKELPRRFFRDQGAVANVALLILSW